MVEFLDDFNRADGPVGNGWSVTASGIVVTGNVCGSTSSRRAWRYPGFAGTYQRVEADVWATNNQSAAMKIKLKVGAAPGDYYLFAWTFSGGNYQLQITRVGSAGGRSVANGWFAGVDHNPKHLTCIYDGGTLTLIYNGSTSVSGADNAYSANMGVGFVTTTIYSRMDNFYCSDGPAVAFDAEPEPLVQMAEVQTLTFTGEGTSWVPGTPGEPIFTVDKGELANQSVSSATSASADYTPPQADDVATFTDPSTGLTDEVALSTGFQVSGGTEFSQAVVDLLEATATESGGLYTLLLNYAAAIGGYSAEISIANQIIELYKMLRVVSGEPPAEAPAMSQADALWWILNGHEQPDPENNVLAGILEMMPDVANTATGMTALRTVALLTLQDVLDAIAAIPPADLTDVLAQLTAIRTLADLTLQSVIDAVESARGAGLPTIKDARDDIAGIRTGANYSLDSVKTWVEAVRGAGLPTIKSVLDAIAAIPPADLSAVLSAITAMRGADNVDLTQLHDQGGQIQLDLAADTGLIRGDITGVRGPDARDLTVVYDAILALPQSQVDLSPVLTAIANLSDKIDALGGGVVLWPGPTGVDFGAPVALGGEMELAGPLDGAIIEVSGSGEGKSRYGSGTWTNKYRMGWYMFVGSGDWAEDFRWLGPNRQVITPTRLLTASKLVLYCYPGVTGTVTPWTLKAV